MEADLRGWRVGWTCIRTRSLRSSRLVSRPVLHARQNIIEIRRHDYQAWRIPKTVSQLMNLIREQLTWKLTGTLCCRYRGHHARNLPPLRLRVTIRHEVLRQLRCEPRVEVVDRHGVPSWWKRSRSRKSQFLPHLTHSASSTDPNRSFSSNPVPSPKPK